MTFMHMLSTSGSIPVGVGVGTRHCSVGLLWSLRWARRRMSSSSSGLPPPQLRHHDAIAQQQESSRTLLSRILSHQAWCAAVYTTKSSVEEGAVRSPGLRHCRLCDDRVCSTNPNGHAFESYHLLQEILLERAVLTCIAVRGRRCGTSRLLTAQSRGGEVHVPYGAAVPVTADDFLAPLLPFVADGERAVSDLCLRVMPFVFGERLLRCHAARQASPLVGMMSSTIRSMSFSGIASAFVRSRASASSDDGTIGRATIDVKRGVLVLPSHRSVASFVAFVTSPETLQQVMDACMGDLERRIEALCRSSSLESILATVSSGQRGLEYQRVECYGDHNFGSHTAGRIRALFDVNPADVHATPAPSPSEATAMASACCCESWDVTASTATSAFEFLRIVVESNDNMDGLAAEMHLVPLIERTLSSGSCGATLSATSLSTRISVLKSANSVKSGGDMVEALLGQLRLAIRTLRSSSRISDGEMGARDDLSGGTSTSYVVEFLQGIVDDMLDVMVLRGLVARGWHTLVPVATEVVALHPAAVQRLVASHSRSGALGDASGASSSGPFGTGPSGHTHRHPSHLHSVRISPPSPRRRLLRGGPHTQCFLPPRLLLQSQPVTKSDGIDVAWPGQEVGESSARTFNSVTFADLTLWGWCPDFIGAPALAASPEVTAPTVVGCWRDTTFALQEQVHRDT